MSTKGYLKLTGSVFALIGVLHALRIYYGWEVEIGRIMVPMWLSIAAVIASAFLVYRAFTLSKKEKVRGARNGNQGPKF